MCAAYLAAPAQRSAADIRTQLERQTQELMDAIAAGNRDPWQRYLHDAVLVTGEDGRTWRKHELLADMRPFPKEMWGKLRVTGFEIELHGSTAVGTCVNDEQQGYYGQTRGLIHTAPKVRDSEPSAREPTMAPDRARTTPGRVEGGDQWL